MTPAREIMASSPPRSTFSEPRRRQGGAEGGWGPLVAVIAALLALALVPLALGRQVADVESEIADVLEPARELSDDLALVHAREIATFQSYLLSGEESTLGRYREVRAEERGIYDELTPLAARMALPVREKLAALSAVAARWHVRHEAALLSDSARLDYLANFPEDQRRNDELLSVSRELTDAIGAEVEAGRVRMDEVRALQLRITIGLVVVALFGTMLVALIGVRLRGLVEESRDQRVRAVQARREADAILDGTGDGVLGLDLDGRCTSLNRAGAQLLGLQENDLLGRSVHDIIHHDDDGGDGTAHRPEDCPILAAVRSGTTVRETEDVLRRRDGAPIPVHWTVGPMIEGLHMKGAVLTFTDMREVRAAEEALRQAVRARDEVIAVVSHDLRNPLGTIAAAAGMLMEIEFPPEKRRENLAVIVRATERMNRLIGDLLDMARIEGGGLSTELAEIELGPLLDEAVALSRPLARERGLALRCFVDPELPPVRADRDRILQVLSNLIGNALKFTHRGEIRLAAEVGEAGDVVVSVADTGKGIAPEDLDHVFDRFWQQRRSDREGAGLGLAIVRGILLAHGGRIWVESRPGEGSTFRFTVPVAAAPAPRRTEVRAEVETA